MNRWKQFLMLLISTFTVVSLSAQTKARPSNHKPERAQAISAEEASEPAHKQLLEIKSKVLLQNTAGILGGRAHCDSEGNFYLRGMKSNFQEAFFAPLGKYDSAGELKASLAAPDIPDRKLSLGQLTIDNDDNVYIAAVAVARGKREIGYALKFDKEGKLKSTIRLEAPVRPDNVVGLKGGELLVSGRRIPQDDDDSRNEAYTGIFSEDGKLVKRLGFDEDSFLKERADSDAFGADSTVAIVWGSAASSADGNAYVMRATSPAKIHVISPAGEVVRTLTVDPEDPRLLAHWLQESGGALVIVFSKIGAPGKIIKVVDRYTGESLATYDPGPIGSALGCFNPPSDFTFIGQEAGKMQLVHAVPK